MPQPQEIPWTSVIAVLALICFHSSLDVTLERTPDETRRPRQEPPVRGTMIQPTPTLNLAVGIDRAYLALHDGDYKAAIALFQEALDLGDETARQQLLLL